MANNRLALVCKECKEGAFLAKYYPSQGWFTVPETGQDYLNSFLVKHSHSDAFDGGNDFKIEYENNGDFKWFNYEERT